MLCYNTQALNEYLSKEESCCKCGKITSEFYETEIELDMYLCLKCSEEFNHMYNQEISRLINEFSCER